MVVVSGRLQIRSWTDNEGNRRRTAEVVADSVYFGESKKDASGNVSEYETQTAAASTVNAYQIIDADDDQLPF